jgi:hypothetical protein
MDLLLKLLVRLLLLAVLVMSVGGYVAFRQKIEPKLSELREKDSIRYFEMVAEAKALHLGSAQKMFYELDAMTPTQAAILRYNKFNARWAKEPEFRQDVLREQKIVRELHREMMSSAYKGEQENITSFEKVAPWVLNKWESMSSWEKGLVLREKCYDYLNRENMNNKERKDGLSLTRFDGMEEKRVEKKLFSELCEKWVPLGEKEELVEKGLDNLKLKMNFLDYSTILKELGIQDEKAFNFSKQFKRFVGDFIGS